MAKLTSETGKASVAVSPDGASIIFRDDQRHQVYWPLKDWPDLKDYIDKKYSEHKNQ